MYLHEAMITEFDQNNNAWKTYEELAQAINANQSYVRGDHQPLPASQISARAKQYEHLFEFDRSGNRVCIRLSR